MKTFFYTLSLFFFALSGFSQETEKLYLGDTYFLQDGYVIDFIEVTEDSRCPSDTTCVWKGQAKAIVMLCKDGKKVTTKELLFKGSKEEEFSHSFGKEETKITYNLMPYPKQNTLGKLNYYLEFVIE